MNYESSMDTKSKLIDVIGWLLGALFLIIGILNLIYIHPVPGIFYLLFSIIYYPPLNSFLKLRFGFSIPLAVKLILALVIIWGTLAVTDLAEMYGL